MTNGKHARNVEGLRNHAAAKSNAARKRIDAALSTLLKNRAQINFNSVASLANVYKTTLYNHSEYRVRIEHLRRNNSSVSSGIVKHNVSDKGKDVIIASKNNRIRELESEVERLSGVLKRCYANEYDKY